MNDIWEWKIDLVVTGLLAGQEVYSWRSLAYWLAQETHQRK